MSGARLVAILLLVPALASAQPGSEAERKRREIERQLRLPKTSPRPPAPPEPVEPDFPASEAIGADKASGQRGEDSAAAVQPVRRLVAELVLRRHQFLHLERAGIPVEQHPPRADADADTPVAEPHIQIRMTSAGKRLQDGADESASVPERRNVDCDFAVVLELIDRTLHPFDRHRLPLGRPRSNDDVVAVDP